MVPDAPTPRMRIFSARLSTPTACSIFSKSSSWSARSSVSMFRLNTLSEMVEILSVSDRSSKIVRTDLGEYFASSSFTSLNPAQPTILQNRIILDSAMSSSAAIC